MATKREEQLSPEEEAKARDMKRARLLANGISDEARAILEEHVGLHLPVFQTREPDGFGGTRTRKDDPRTLCLEAALKDGEQAVVKWLIIQRKKGKSDNKYNH